MNFTEAIDYLQNLSKFGINLGMERIERLLSMLGNPERDVKVVHVAGTNGKGSTSMMITAVLQAAGYRVGVYTSPHLQSYTERFVVDGRPITEEDFAQSIDQLKPLLEEIVQTTQDQPTEFEVLTAMAFTFFRDQKVDIVILEVGLGGTLDSTNVITPIVSAITNVAFDHMDKLGSSLQEIATHKAGIIKSGIPVVTAATGEALIVIEQEAVAKGAQIINVLELCSWQVDEVSLMGQRFTMRTALRTYPNMSIRLLGPHQIVNSAVALMVLEQLQQHGFLIDGTDIYRGFAAATWPGRFEVLSQAPVIILDGAHNPDGAQALRQTFETSFADKQIVMVVGVLADKDYQSMLADFAAVADTMILTTADSPRAADPVTLAASVGACETVIIPDLAEAVAAGVRMAGLGKVMCVCGSLYTIGKAREILIGNRG